LKIRRQSRKLSLAVLGLKMIGSFLFADYWHSIPGSKGCKLDWSGTWRNWCRRNFSRGPVRPGAFNGQSPKSRGTYRPSISEMAQALEELEAEREFAQ
jgi:hypothetical protein